MQTRAGMIVTFLALLEMIRLKLVRVFQQAATSGPIRVYKRAAKPTPPTRPHAGAVGVRPTIRAAARP